MESPNLLKCKVIAAPIINTRIRGCKYNFHIVDDLKYLMYEGFIDSYWLSVVLLFWNIIYLLFYELGFYVSNC